MATFFALLFLVGLIGMFVGLIKPALFNKINPSNSRIKILMGGVVVNMVLLALVGVFAPKVETKPEQANEASKSEPVNSVDQENKQQSIKAEANLGMTPEQFRKEFNKKLKDLDIKSVRSVGEFDIKPGEVRDIFQVDFSDDIVLTGSVNKDGMLHGLTFIVVPGENYEKAMMDTLILTGISAGIVNTPENKDKTSKAVIDLINKALDGIENEKNSHKQTIGNVEYMALASQFTGLWFVIETPENK